MPLRAWIRSANFAIEGILQAAKTQKHLRYHFYIAAFVLMASYILGVTKSEFLFISLAVIIVLVAELLNTAVEAIVDLLSPEHHEKAKQAKDIAAGAVLITAFGAVVIGYIILFPYFTDLFDTGFHISKHSQEEISVISFIIVLIIVVLLKAYFGKGHPLSGGVPSGHSALAFSVWVSITYITANFFASFLSFIIALMIAQSRVTTKIHKAWEVVLGGLIGASVTFALFQLFS